MAARNPTPIGQTFNRLTVLAEAPKYPSNNNRRVTARCECGTVKDYVLSEVVRGKTRSCGCLQAEGLCYRTHGHTSKRFSPEYFSWSSMKTRCTNQHRDCWVDYGERGIKVCDRWSNSFENFLADMGPRPPGTTLDRYPNGDGDYEPGNCRWATKTQQARNTRRATLIAFDGVTKPISAWAEEYGLAYNTLIARIHRLKWPVEQALKTPPRRW